MKLKATALRVWTTIQGKANPLPFQNVAFLVPLSTTPAIPSMITYQQTLVLLGTNEHSKPGTSREREETARTIGRQRRLLYAVVVGLVRSVIIIMLQ